MDEVFSASDWDVRSSVQRYDKPRKPAGPSIKCWTNQRRNPLSGCILNLKKIWIIHRGLVSVVNSAGVSPLSVAEVIFSSSVTDRSWILDHRSINISSGHRFHFHWNTWLFHLPTVFLHNCDSQMAFPFFSPALPFQPEISCCVYWAPWIFQLHRS